MPAKAKKQLEISCMLMFRMSENRNVITSSPNPCPSLQLVLSCFDEGIEMRSRRVFDRRKSKQNFMAVISVCWGSSVYICLTSPERHMIFASTPSGWGRDSVMFVMCGMQASVVNRLLFLNDGRVASNFSTPVRARELRCSKRFCGCLQYVITGRYFVLSHLNFAII